MMSDEGVAMSDDIGDLSVWGKVGWTAPEILSKSKEDQAVVFLCDYFGPNGRGFRESYSGAQYTEVGGGGDASENADTITAEDIFAVSTLSVRVPPTHGLQLLGRGVTKDGLEATREWRDGIGHRSSLKSAKVPSVDEAPIDARAVRAALANIPTDLALADVPSEEIVDLLERVDILWREIRRKGIRTERSDGTIRKHRQSTEQVITSKLLARKRPHLLPVIDSLVASQLSHDRKKRTDFYCNMWKIMRDSELALPVHLSVIRKKGYKQTSDERIRQLSDLRVFDIIVWMAAKNARSGA